MSRIAFLPSILTSLALLSLDARALMPTSSCLAATAIAPSRILAR
jgi:hypothetical protein